MLESNVYAPQGDLTMIAATAVIEEGCARAGAGDLTIDLSQVRKVDSAALATLFAWQRCAARAGSTLAVRNIPPELHSLAELYGVAELIPVREA